VRRLAKRGVGGGGAAFSEAIYTCPAAPNVTLAAGPGGNGCLFAALADGGALDDQAARGVTGVHVSTVDNIACRLGDPLFTGLCVTRGVHVGSKVVRKACPTESVGLLALQHAGGTGGTASLSLTAVEYSELDEATATAVDPSTGRLAFDAGNACIHYFSLPFLRAAAAATAAAAAGAGAGPTTAAAAVDPRDPSTCRGWRPTAAGAR
jgi:UDP-N-acetylglucosamine/UDP-N-acetylgalactosamine diphosphorylase